MNINKKQYLRCLNLESQPQVIDSVSGGINVGCNLYVGSASPECSITVKNISGDEIRFFNPIQGSIIPFSVTEIISVDNMSKIVALW